MISKKVKQIAKNLRRFCLQPHVNRKEILGGLVDLGLRRGGDVLVHSSLSAFGYVVGGPQTIIEALIEYVGPQGNLIFPAHTWNLVNRGKRSFDVCRDRSEVGVLSEAFRNWPGVIRSVHPSHSLSALGPDSEYILHDHLYSESPCGSETPYARIMERNGQVLFLGVGLARNTLFHSVEAMSKVHYLLKSEKDCFQITDASGNQFEAHVRCHAAAVPSRFASMEKPLVESGCLRAARIGNSRSMVLDAKPFRNHMIDILNESPEFLTKGCSLPVDFSLAVHRNAGDIL